MTRGHWSCLNLLPLILIVLVAVADRAQSDVIADSEADWARYRNDGLDLGGDPVTPGSTIDFVGDDRSDSSGDLIHLTASVTPEPAALLLLVLAGLALFSRRPETVS